MTMGNYHSGDREIGRSDTMLVSTAYLPPIDYMAVLTRFRDVVIEQHETYPKQSWRNRCRIVTASGVQDLSIPVSRPRGRYSKTGEVMIKPSGPWRGKHWRAIRSAYGKAPYFAYYEDLFAPLFLEKHSATGEVPLITFNEHLLTAVFRCLGVPVRLSKTASFSKNPVSLHDLRDRFSPKASRQHPATFSGWPGYHQVFSDRLGFIPNASVIDLIFHLGPDSLHYLKGIDCGRLPPGIPS